MVELQGQNCAAIESGLVELGGSAVDLLRDLLATGSSTARWRAASALGRIADPASAGTLVTALEDRDSYVRYQAERALALIGPDAIEQLTIVLAHGTDQTQLAAARILGSLRATEACAGLIAALKSRRHDLRSEAAKALGSIATREAIEALQTRLRPLIGERNLDVRGSIREAVLKAKGQSQVHG